MRSREQKQVKAPETGTETGSHAAQEKQIGDALRAVYHEAVQEEIPDDLLDLLRKLD